MAKGQKTGGRIAGVPNKITTAVKDAMMAVYSDLQSAAASEGVDIGPNSHFKVWALGNPTEFYKLWAKMLPTEVKADLAGGLTVSNLIDLSGLTPEQKRALASIKLPTDA